MSARSEVIRWMWPVWNKRLQNMSWVVCNFLDQFIITRREQFIERDSVSVIQVPKTSTARQDRIQPRLVSGRTQARPGWRTVRRSAWKSPWLGRRRKVTRGVFCVFAGPVVHKAVWSRTWVSGWHGLYYSLLYGWSKCVSVIGSNGVTWYKINFTSDYTQTQ